MMTMNRIGIDVIAQIKGWGFDVYMRDLDDSYLYFSDGERIGYLQYNRVGGYTLSTVHKPNRETGTGTGYQVARHADKIDREMLEECFRIPSWGSRAVSVPWPSVEAWRSANEWNQTFKKV